MAENKYLNDYYRNPYLQRRTYLNPGATFAPSVYVPEQADLNLLARSLDKIEERELATAQQETAIAKMLGELDMNTAEDVWRTEYANRLNGRIKALVDVGDYSNAMTTAVKTAKDIYLNPAVRGRIRANQEYKKFIEETQRRKDIDQRTKNWALATNPYSYEDITDENGNIVGGSEWKPSNTPVSNVNLASLADKAIAWAKPNGYSGSSAMFVDAYGNKTKDINKAVDILYETSSGYQGVGKDKLEQAIKAAIDMTPGARESIKQDYDIANWEYNKLTPEEKRNIGDSEITDANGRLLTQEEYLAKKVNPWLNASAWSNRTNTIKYGNGLQTAFALKQKQQYGDAERINKIFSPTGAGYNVTYSVVDQINKASGTLKDAVSAIEGAAPSLSRHPQWKAAVLKHDYEKMADMVKKVKTRNGKTYYDVLSPSAKRIIDRSLTNIYSNKDFVREIYQNTDSRTKDAIEAKSAIDSFQTLPANNNFTKDFNSIMDKFNRGKAAENYQIRFNSKDDVDSWLSSMGLSESTARANGFIFGSEDERPTITFSSSSNFVPKAIISLSQDSDAMFRIPWKSTQFRSLDANGNIINKISRDINPYIPGISNIVNELGTLYKGINNNLTRLDNRTRMLTSTSQSIRGEHPAIVDARRRGEKQSEIDAIKKDVNSALAKTFDGDWAQMTVYGVNDDTKTMTLMDNESRGSQMHNIKAHLQADKADIDVMSAGPLDGYVITLHGSLKNGVIQDDGQDVSYFITTGVSDPYLEEFKNDAITRGNHNYANRVKFNGSYKTKLGTKISNISDAGCKINGRPASKEIGVQLMTMDELMTNLQINPNDRVSAARLLQLAGNDAELVDVINNYLTNNSYGY